MEKRKIIRKSIRNNKEGDRIIVFDKKEWQKQYYQKNKEYYGEYQKKWRKENREKRNKYQGKYQENHPEYQREWKEKNPEYQKEYDKKYRQEHKEYFIEYLKKWRKENNYCSQWKKTEKGKANNQRSNSKRRSRLRGIINTLTAEEWQGILKQHNFKCVYCGKNLLDLFDTTRDHIIPISKGGNNTKENIAPACRSCNAKKYNKIISTKIFPGTKETFTIGFFDETEYPFFCNELLVASIQFLARG